MRRVGGVWHEVVVHVVGDAESDAMHRAILGEEGSTDVITQAYDAIPPEPPGICGELFVNADQACRAAPKRAGWSVAKELLLYVAHGMDHLSGADDHAPADRASMRRRELRWLGRVRLGDAACAAQRTGDGMRRKALAARRGKWYNLGSSVKAEKRKVHKDG